MTCCGSQTILDEIRQLIVRAEFYDLFGMLIFPFIALFGGWMLWKKKMPKKIYLWILVVIGVLGTIVDGALVSKLLFMIQ